MDQHTKCSFCGNDTFRVTIHNKQINLYCTKENCGKAIVVLRFRADSVPNRN